MARIPETRRKVPRYFTGRADLRINWSPRGCWEVSFLCDALGTWQYERLAAKRIGPKLEAQAVAAAVKLLQQSAQRWDNAARDAARRSQELLNAASAFTVQRPGRPDSVLKLGA